ncbi:DUF4097 family beta strand repeat-containing protein [Sporosarcina pasteurii]|nr:DUF4097 family beta strand repeat-containing protein [Sporosarcina pasteurii]MDS9471145.1 DUF4097 family beta strand repeat-containing protein [Sporosarcina pasteurii]QBQ05215.1 hypothetical protein E2C16_05810 [Sporosarcina pasteurii]
MRRQDIMRVAVLFIGIVLLINVLLFLFRGGHGSLSKSIPGDEIVNIHITTDIGDIQIAPHDGDDIRVHLEGKTTTQPAKSYKLIVKEKYDELTIRAKTKTKWLPFQKSAGSYTVLIELPSKQYEQLYVEADVANIYMEAIAASNSFVTTRVGHITLKNVAGSLNSTTEVGDNTIELPTVSENISATSTVGNVIVKMKEVPLALQSDIHNSVGNTTINLPNAEEGSIGIDGPLLKLTVEVGNISVLLVDG